MKKIIYFDHHATTPLDPRVLKTMMPFLKKNFGNASSTTHELGRVARAAVEKARRQVADLIGANANEIYFTSGATESNNLAIKGIAEAYREQGRHIISITTEHKTVLDPLKRLGMQGFEITLLKVQPNGRVNIDELLAAIRPSTILISVMWANNEIGVLQPIHDIGKIAKTKKILFHCDAVQAAGRVPIDVNKAGIDLLSFSAHKMHGPKGVGALFVRKENPRVKLLPLFDGGGQEMGFRSGTLNVPGIVGFGEACRIAQKELTTENKRLKNLRQKLHTKLTKAFPGLMINGDEAERLSNNLNVSLPDIDAAELLKGLPGVALSSGSACLSSSPERSYVLKSLGLSDKICRSAIRFGLGRFNTPQEIDAAVKQIVRVAGDLKKRSSL